MKRDVLCSFVSNTFRFGNFARKILKFQLLYELDYNEYVCVYKKLVANIRTFASRVGLIYEFRLIFGIAQSYVDARMNFEISLMQLNKSEHSVPVFLVRLNDF